MLKKFRDFVARGNVLDLAVGVVIGAAFGKIVSSLVTDVLMPPLGVLIGKVDFSELFINLSDKPARTLADAKASGIPTLNYGIFANAIFQFFIVAAVVFFVVELAERLYQKGPATSKTCPWCAETIPRAARRCGRCTSDLAVPAPPPLPAEPTGGSR